MRRLLPWIALIVTVTVVELVTRFPLPFDLRRVLIVETMLFLVAGLATFLLAARTPRAVGWRYVVQVTLAWSFVLAAVRAGLWAAGAPVARANLVILVLGTVAVGVSWLRSRSRPTLGPVQAPSRLRSP